jgi:hypothetical protein
MLEKISLLMSTIYIINVKKKGGIKVRITFKKLILYAIKVTGTF